MIKTLQRLVRVTVFVGTGLLTLAACAHRPMHEAAPPTTAPPPDTRSAEPATTATVAPPPEAALRPIDDFAKLRAASATARKKRAMTAFEAKRRTPPPRASLPLRGLAPSAVGRDMVAVHMIDVGQADAILVEFECSASLIDTGLDYSRNSGARAKFAEYLRWFFKERRPDLHDTLLQVVLSHSHADHANGVRVIVGEGPNEVPLTVLNAVDNGYDATGGKDEQLLLRQHAGNAESVAVSGIEWLSGATSDVIDPFGPCTGSKVDPVMRALWGQWVDIEGAPSNPNHHSVVLRLDFGKASFLFTGDLQTGDSEQPGGLEVMLTDYAEDLSVFDVDVLKVAHHGAANGTTDALLRATSPCIAMLGVGDPDRTESGSAGDHGHPRTATMARLQDGTFGVSGERPLAKVAAFPAYHMPYELMDVDRAIYGTAWDGSYVVFASASGDFAVETETGPARHAVACP